MTFPPEPPSLQSDLLGYLQLKQDGIKDKTHSKLRGPRAGSCSRKAVGKEFAELRRATGVWEAKLVRKVASSGASAVLAATFSIKKEMQMIDPNASFGFLI